MTKRKIALSTVILFATSVFCILLLPSSTSAYSYPEEILRKSMYRAVAADCADHLPDTLERDYIENGGLITYVGNNKAFNKTKHPLPTNIDDKTTKPFPYAGSDTQKCLSIMFTLGSGSSTIYHRVLGINALKKLKDPDFIKEYLGYSSVKNGSNDEGEACVTYKTTMEFVSPTGKTPAASKGTARTQNYCFALEKGKVKDLRREVVTIPAKGGIEDAYAPTAADHNITVGNGKIGLPSRSGDSINYTSFVGMTKEKAIDTLKGTLQKWFNDLIDHRGGEGIGGSGAIACLAAGAGGSSGMLSDRYGAYCTYYKTVFDRYGISLTSNAPSEGHVYMSFRPLKNTLVVDSTKNNTTSNPNLERYKDNLAIVKKLTKTESDNQAYVNTFLTYSDKIMLYQHYLLGVYGIEVSCKEESKPEDGNGITFFNAGQTKPGTNCRYVGRDTENKQQKDVKVNDVEAITVGGKQMYQFSGKRIDVDGVIDFLRSVPGSTELEYPSDSSSDYYDTDVTDPDDMNKTEGKSKKSEEVSCYDTAGNSNWLVCPIIDNNKGAAKMLYGFIEGMLQVNTKLFTPNEKGINGTLIAWESFRNIANVVFIIVFVIVILSQITGLGVDNYGIKKILPKLILGALLVNISYYICQACVDVANITGGGVKGILQSAADRMKGTEELKVQFDGIHAESIGIKATAALLIIGIATAAVAVSGGSLLVPLVVGVVGVAIGLLFFATLLAVRQGLAVILVVISPMAFIAYMLPNTKTLFTKWVKVFSGVLLAYPICAFALYGGELTSNIILMAQAGTGGNIITNFPLALTSAIISIAPVFFVPGLITKSMSGIAAASNRVQKGVSALAKGGTHRALAPRMDEVAKKAKYDRAKNWLRNPRHKNPRTSFGRAGMKMRMGAVDAYERDSAKMYETQAASKDMKGLVEMATQAFGADGSFDSEKFEAAFAAASVIDPQRVWTDLFSQVSNTDAYKNLSQAEDQEGFAKLSSTLARHGGVIGKAINKENHATTTSGALLPLQSYSDLATGALGSRISNMDEAIADQMDKDQFETIGNMITAAKTKSDIYFSDEQLCHAIGSSMSGSKQTAFAKHIINNMSQTKASDCLAKLSDEQWGTANENNLRAMFNQAGGMINGKTYSSFDDFNHDRAESVKKSGNAELIGKLRGAQRQAYDKL